MGQRDTNTFAHDPWFTAMDCEAKGGRTHAAVTSLGIKGAAPRLEAFDLIEGHQP